MAAAEGDGGAEEGGGRTQRALEEGEEGVWVEAWSRVVVHGGVWMGRGGDGGRRGARGRSRGRRGGEEGRARGRCMAVEGRRVAIWTDGCGRRSAGRSMGSLVSGRCSSFAVLCAMVARPLGRMCLARPIVPLCLRLAAFGMHPSVPMPAAALPVAALVGEASGRRAGRRIRGRASHSGEEGGIGRVGWPGGDADEVG